MNGWYITRNGDEYEFIADDTIYVSGMNITKLVIPDGVRAFYCSDNLLTKLDLPDSIQFIRCMNNKLTELIVPDDCIVDCDNTVKLITRTMYNRSKRLKNILS